MRFFDRIRLQRKYNLGLLQIAAAARQLKADGVELKADDATAEAILSLLVADPSLPLMAGAEVGFDWASLVELIKLFMPLILLIFGL